MQWCVPSKNHRPDLTSTSHKIFAAQFLRPAGPIWAKHAGIKSALQRVFTLARWAEQQDATQNKLSVFFNYRPRMTSCVMTLKPRLLQTGCVTPARRVARRFKIHLAAPHSVATSAVCTNHVHQALQKDCLGSAFLNAWIA